MKNETKELKPKNDVIFKNLFSKAGNEDMLRELLEAILNIKITEIEVQKEVELSKMHINEKYGRLDLKAIVNKNTIVIIEMQMKDTCNMEKRAMYYVSKVIGSSLNTGETYEQIKDIYIISILNYEITNLKEYFLDTVTVENKYRKYEIIKGIKYYFIELPKFRKCVNEIKTKFEQWLAFIDYEDKEMVEMSITKNKLVEKAQKEYEYLTGDAATMRLQELREKAILDERSAYLTGKKRGEQNGERKGKIETAIAMMKNNINREIIAKCTGLNEKELDKVFSQKV